MVRHGRVRCRAFPIVIITSNGEREFPAPFMRRCLKLNMNPPSPEQLGAMIAAQFGSADGIDGLASDQLLNAVPLAAELVTSGAYQTDEDWQELLTAIWHPLGGKSHMSELEWHGVRDTLSAATRSTAWSATSC